MNASIRRAARGLCLLAAAEPGLALAAGASVSGPAVAGVPVDFMLFALVLLGVALFHHHTLKVALTGAVVISIYQLLFTGFKAGPGLAGLAGHFGHEWVTLANLLGLLLGFALLADHFEKSRLPEVLPHLLPDDWKGGFVLLVGVFIMSGFLDNIAAAMIGGTMAGVLFQHRVHIGYLAAIVAASNAGGAGSVVGDTTTTMMWIAGASPLWVLEAYVGGIVALMIFGYFAAKQQHAFQPIQKDDTPGVHVEYGRLAVVGIILASAVGANLWFNLNNVAMLDHFPVIGTAVMLALLASAPIRAPQWSLLPGAFKGSIFLLSLVWCASLMPVDKLPSPSWPTAMGLGFVSAVFDNIPLTALAIRQDGYDWGFLAFAVGFGGSMIWFGSSAGVALSNMYPEARSVGAWIKGGWHVVVGYVVGYLVMVALVGWHPHPIKPGAASATPAAMVAPAAGAKP
ncbi:citrate transporter [Ideonella sp. A 288]|uniref:citrate transporter n=1 Tax=Ideonella sp. A 288 TaxID=1962181 RepID=UPI0018FE9387|nr:citrate transporter [Ideonella sp. A 288]